MTDEAHALRRGEAAARLLADEATQEALADIREAIYQEFRRAPISNADGLVRLKMLIQSVDGVESRLQAYANDAAVLKKEMDDTERLNQFQKQRGYRAAA